MMVNYNQRVSKPTVFAMLFGYNEIVIGIVKKSLEEALSEDNDDDDLIVVSKSESDEMSKNIIMYMTKAMASV